MKAMRAKCIHLQRDVLLMEYFTKKQCPICFIFIVALPNCVKQQRNKRMHILNKKYEVVYFTGVTLHSN